VVSVEAHVNRLTVRHKLIHLLVNYKDSAHVRDLYNFLISRAVLLAPELDRSASVDLLFNFGVWSQGAAR